VRGLVSGVRLRFRRSPVASAVIGAAVGKARDYAAALDARLLHVEHVADTGLLGGDTAPCQPGECCPVHLFGFGGGGR
jgi:hypothetical protein